MSCECGNFEFSKSCSGSGSINPYSCQLLVEHPSSTWFGRAASLIERCPKTSPQYNLFTASKRGPNLMKIFDSLNNRYGRDVLFIAAQGSNQNRAMRREFLSPQYTTKWSDIPTVKA